MATEHIAKATGNGLTASQERIDYIDALRGLSMVLVVLAHVFLYMHPRHWDGSPLAAMLMSFRMPLFFFVSGFFAFKPIAKWTSSRIGDIMARKARAQILCATVFFILFAWVNHEPLFGFASKGYGYFWFTISLFQMFTVYVLLNVISRLIKRDIAGIGLLVLMLLSAGFGMERFTTDVGKVLSWTQTVNYFQFFATGVLVRKYSDIFEKIIDNNIFRAVVICLFLGGCVILYSDWYHAPKVYSEYLIQQVAHRYTGLFTVLIFFRNLRDYFAGQATPARFLKFTGKRTLDIYMLHMFFMPRLTMLYPLLSLRDMSIIKLAIGLTVALLIVGLCLVVSQTLRSSHFLSVWLFGVRPYPKKSESVPANT